MAQHNIEGNDEYHGMHAAIIKVILSCLLVVSFSCAQEYTIIQDIITDNMTSIAQLMQDGYAGPPSYSRWSVADYSDYLHIIKNYDDLVCYTISKDNIMVGAIIGFSLAGSLQDEFAKKTAKASRDKKNSFYLAELVIDQKHQKKGLSNKLIRKLTEYAEGKSYKQMIASVVADPNYDVLDKYWKHVDFAKTNYSFKASWLTFVNDKTQDQTHTVCLWEKVLSK